MICQRDNETQGDATLGFFAKMPVLEPYQTFTTYLTLFGVATTIYHLEEDFLLDFWREKRVCLNISIQKSQQSSKPVSRSLTVSSVKGLDLDLFPRITDTSSPR